MTFNDLQNEVLFRLRAHGVNFGNAPQNQPGDFDPPYLVALAINTAYQKFLTDTVESGIVKIPLSVPSTASQTQLPLSPPPAFAGSANPVVMWLHEFTYTPAGSNENYVPIVSAARFRRMTGGYARQLGSYSLYPYAVAQRFAGALDMWPGTAKAGDTITLLVCPDPIATASYYASATLAPTAAQGNALSQPTDVPLVPAQFHEAIVEHALVHLAMAANKQLDFQTSMQRYAGFVQAAQLFGATFGEGDPDQGVSDPYAGFTI